MPELDEENQTRYMPPAPPRTKEVTFMASSIMDVDVVDLDLDNPWPSDQMGFVSNPMSPFLISEQPCSPLWAFSDADNDDKLSGHVNYPLFLKCLSPFLSFTCFFPFLFLKTIIFVCLDLLYLKYLHLYPYLGFFPA